MGNTWLSISRRGTSEPERKHSIMMLTMHFNYYNQINLRNSFTGKGAFHTSLVCPQHTKPERRYSSENYEEKGRKEAFEVNSKGSSLPQKDIRRGKLVQPRLRRLPTLYCFYSRKGRKKQNRTWRKVSYPGVLKVSQKNSLSGSYS